MNPLPLLLASLLVVGFTAPALASPPPDLKPYGACLGYDMCADVDGYAIACLKYKQRWICAQCEACGNGPWLP